MRIRKSSKILFLPPSGLLSHVHRRLRAWCYTQRPLARVYIPTGSSDCPPRFSQGNRGCASGQFVFICVWREFCADEVGWVANADLVERQGSI